MNPSTTTVLVDRNVRQRSLVPLETLATCHALVIGIGAIGRQVALQLAAVGVPRLTLYDDDTVAVENLAVQGYWPDDLGNPKVEATGTLCRRIFPQAQLTLHAERFKRSTAALLDGEKRLAVFCCVDRINTRRLLWETLRDRVALFIDGRMSGEVIRVLASDAPLVDDHYATTLFDQADAYVGACTARSTIYAAS